MNHKTLTAMENTLLKEIGYLERKLNLPKNILSFINQGKRIRAKLIHSPFLASIVELTHASSLIHDDIIDESNLRRGLPTAFSLMSTGGAASIGYLLFSRLFLSIIRLKPFVYHHYFQILSEMCIGQIMEIESTQRRKGSIQKYLHTIRYKTGSLFAFCFGIKPTSWKREDASLGYKFGTAFQILDDLYDVTLDVSSIGKPIGQDMKQGILTLPDLYGNIDSAKNKALAILQSANIRDLPIDWKNQLEELIAKIKQVSCSTSPENRDNNKSFRLSVQNGE